MGIQDKVEEGRGKEGGHANKGIGECDKGGRDKKRNKNNKNMHLKIIWLSSPSCFVLSKWKFVIVYPANIVRSFVCVYRLLPKSRERKEKKRNISENLKI